MWIQYVQINNVRCFENATITLARNINIVVGKNNSGKSTFIKCIAQPQHPSINQSDARKGSVDSKVSMHFHDCGTYFGHTLPNHVNVYDFHLANGAGSFQRGGALTNIEPNNFIFPFFSHRKVKLFSEEVKETLAKTVGINLQNLTAKLAVISTYSHPSFNVYKETCEALLGFLVVNIPSPNGMHPGIYITHDHRIPLTAMGDGVALVVAFIIDLLLAENKLFLIEEPENDIHPSALKSILNLIAISSRKNQFIISTHSNIVVKQLGSEKTTKVFSIKSNNYPGIPQISQIQEVTSHSDRRAVLEDLGYEYYDEDAYNKWMFFEESSAERIVRDFLIPTFARKLNGKVRTFSCRSVSKVKSRFDEFNNLFSFLNLEPKYKNKAWVFIDHGEAENSIHQQLIESYVKKNSWNADNFVQFSHHDFELYYPAKFEEEFKRIATIANKDAKRVEKNKLLEVVLLWINENPGEAEKEFAQSAKEVIDHLKKIEQC